MTVRDALSSDGTRIVYRVDGDPVGRPLVLIHGWSQSARAWEPVIGGLGARHRVLSIDLRGHGASDLADGGYDSSATWAADLAAVLDAETIGPGAGAVLAGWSYGGLVVADYLAEIGTGAVGGIVLVGAITSIGRGERGGAVGPAMRAAIPDAMSEDPETALRALATFGSALTGTATGVGPQAQALLGASLCTPPRVRAALFARAVGHDDVLRALDVPALVLHGRADRVVDPSAARHAEDLIPTVTASYWEGTEHAPFVEDPDRFVREVTEFTATL